MTLFCSLQRGFVYSEFPLTEVPLYTNHTTIHLPHTGIASYNISEQSRIIYTIIVIHIFTTSKTRHDVFIAHTFASWFQLAIVAIVVLPYAHQVLAPEVLNTDKPLTGQLPIEEETITLCIAFYILAMNT